MTFISDAMHHVYDRVNVDQERTGLIGFSDGASYALSLGPSNGDIFRHIVAGSPGFTAPAAPLIGTPRIFVSHGTEDTILPIRTTKEAIIPTLRSAGYDVTFLEYEGGHSWPPSIRGQALDWLWA